VVTLGVGALLMPPPTRLQQALLKLRGFVSIRQHTSAYVSKNREWIRQHASAYVRIPAGGYVDLLVDSIGADAAAAAALSAASAPAVEMAALLACFTYADVC
jgi:hypothetical protein